VDVFAPGGDLAQTVYPSSVTRLGVDYRIGWLRRQASLRRWRPYSLFLGTPDLAVAVAGIFAALVRRPLVTVCDEIYVGGYQGQAVRHWRLLAPWAMRRARFTVITDLCREKLQRGYARLPASHLFHAYPCCYAELFPAHDRTTLRRELGIAEGDVVLSTTGALTVDRGGHWVAGLMGRLDAHAKLMVQTAGTPEPVLHAVLGQLGRERRIVYLPERLEWRESMRVTSAADIGLVFYLSAKPQFQAMGVSSQKLCTHLWLGQPVVATRQKSFEFLEEYRCGVLVSAEGEVAGAIEQIRSGYAEYSRNALRCAREYIDAPGKYQALTRAFGALCSTCGHGQAR
jgi:hypothetical protein